MDVFVQMAMTRFLPILFIVGIYLPFLTYISPQWSCYWVVSVKISLAGNIMKILSQTVAF